MAIMVHNLGCPDCRDKLQVESRLKTMSESPLKYFCDNGHDFNDTERLMARNPKMLPYTAKARPVPMENAKTLEVKMPGDTMEFLVSKFGVRLNAVAISTLKAMAEPDSFIVDTMNTHRLMAKLGEKPTDGDQLYGLVFSLKEDLDQIRKERDEMRAGGKVPSNEGGKGLKLEFEVDQIVALSEIAKEKQMTIKDFLQQYVTVALKEGWFTR